MKNTLILLLSVVLFSCAKPKTQPVLIDEETFKTEHDGKTVALYTLRNVHGVVTQITNYGGKVVNLWTPDKKGDFADIVIGYETSAEYLNTT